MWSVVVWLGHYQDAVLEKTQQVRAKAEVLAVQILAKALPGRIIAGRIIAATVSALETVEDRNPILITAEI